ncbi:hypothetical protein COT30_02555 [Candidatus Micrarchaeota archaeon CG08_land_8_20_14_0_20_49_17]|nr:MAG: hypothetical protein AUJ13_01665 [Candidatus Micrarchaeota archaeon CG1_02_49_24]PIU09789.1 MAG: hypothetical protein COT30_02555 [Candidatus Micrarchaeota archaeon CG08_land_8_20_14_0_20_49_17]PIZ93974.1 MAG: hypothetical protein COX84_05630 [Candidatus Micrarchaeota archaeon CG_4_10_14_0_2_um_filter_49_7]HII54059.1 DUF521 domain-containing protein [Candidatus Micrarchaeota archaeon]
MKLAFSEKQMLSGAQGNAVKKSMEILVALGEIFGAKRLIDVSSVQIAGVSYKNLGEAGLEFLAEMARDGRARVLTTLNPAGMDLENWRTLGFSEDFAKQQDLVIGAFKRMGVIATCTCTPYLVGNLPVFGQHIAWSESSAVAFANSVIGAKTNREGGPSALASALTGKTPEFGLHLDENRQAQVVVEVDCAINDVPDFGALGHVIGNMIGNKIPLIKGIKSASIEELKSFSASIATYGGTALYHIEGITPYKTRAPKEKVSVSKKEIDEAIVALTDPGDVDFVSIGCPHASLSEIEQVAKLLQGKKVRKEFWICTARPTKKIADSMGVAKTIEDAGAKFACDTCMAVSPLKGRFKCLATDSAKGCYYAKMMNGFKTKILPLKKLVEVALE